jgi:hypothetical protein
LPEFPACSLAYQLGKDHGALAGEGGSARKIESCHFNITGICCPDEGILNFTKVLLSFSPL